MSTEGHEKPYEEPYEESYGEPFTSPPGAGTTAMLIRIFGKKDQEPYGDIVHYHLKKPVPYQGAAELVLRIDAISRSLNLPASGSTFRSVRRPRDETGNVLPGEYWQEEPSDKEPADAGDRKELSQGVPGDGGRKEPSQGISGDGGRKEPSQGMSGDGGRMETHQAAASGDSASAASQGPRVRDTIYLQVFGRQHTSIQGRIWGKATRKRYVSFRSALELIYLLSEAV